MTEKEDVLPDVEGANAAMLPIREVSRLTGVNAVTLRAWERRYGLLKPHRTPKGHRLYSDEHVRQIRAITDWINRGVSVSKVRKLLEDAIAVPEPAASVSDDGVWDIYQHRFIAALKALNEQRLDSVFNQTMSEYPADTVIRRLFEPMFETLRTAWQGLYGDRLEERFLENFLRTRIGLKLYNANRQSQAEDSCGVMFLTLPGEVSEMELLLLSLSAASHGCKAHYLGTGIPLVEIPLAAEKLQVSAVVLHSNSALDRTTLSRDLLRVGQTLTVPVIVAGQSARIHQSTLAPAGFHVLLPGTDQTLVSVIPDLLSEVPLLV
ncbi:MerR family transcriptional regulator [Kistimonas asteriae]|uniref:MerR family transcriptional regulator n=1 Tax=Kistimonas asteriae TaxID=517724 RepID=UPI001BAC4FF2|nr:MerR family transcriptional regulator [Kistimonas asteriae]